MLHSSISSAPASARAFLEVQQVPFPQQALAKGAAPLCEQFGDLFGGCCTCPVDDELLCDILVEVLVALRSIVQRDDGCVDDLSDGKPAIKASTSPYKSFLEAGNAIYLTRRR